MSQRSQQYKTTLLNTAIATTGFASFDPSVRTPSATPARPINMNASTGDNAGEVDLACNSVAKARGYVWQVSTDPNDESKYAYVGQSSKSSYTAKNQPAGVRQWYRCAAVGAGEDVQSPWSDAALGIAN